MKFRCIGTVMLTLIASLSVFTFMTVASEESRQSTVNSQQSAVSSQQSTVNSQQSAFSSQQSAE